MRLRRLDLIRYGRFTDRVIDFGAAEEGHPDFHIVHGPNEAGKSTLFSAWLDFLYGIPVQSPYNFLHDYKTMRIGATLETVAGAVSLVRVKKQSGSLLDGSDRPVGDTVLAADLSGLDRDAYRTMFSLDETSLEQGGEAILASKGDLGQLLFSASAGLSDLASRLDRIRSETEEFHRPRAQKTALADLRRRLDELKAEKDAIDLAASEHARLVAERDKTRSAHDEANRRRASLRVRLEEAGRRLAALPHLARLDGLRRELADMEVLPVAPAHWAQDIPELRRREVALVTALGRLDRDIAQLDQAMSARPDRDPILDRAGDLEALHEPGGRALSEERDLPNRLIEREAAERAIAETVRRLGQPAGIDAARLVLPVCVLGALKGLIADHSGIAERLEAARREANAAEAALADAAQAQAREPGGSAAPEPVALDMLSEALSAVRAVDHAGRLVRARQAEEVARGQLERRISSLRPWLGDRHALALLVAPAASVLSDLGRQIAEVGGATVRAKTELDGLVADLAGQEAEREAAAGVPGIVTDEAARDLRQARETAWAEHRSRLDIDTADRFRQALEADDRATGQRLAQVAEATRLRGMDQAIARLSARREMAEKRLAGAISAQQAAGEELARLVADISPQLPPDMGMAAFEAWCAALGIALEALDALERAERDRSAAEEAVSHAGARLSAALAEAGIHDDGGDLDRLTGSARRFLEAESRRQALRAAIRQQEEDLDRRRAELQRAETARKAWDEAWAAALAGTWLAERGNLPSLAEMTEILDVLQVLGNELERRHGLIDRISKMERDIALFDEVVRALALDLGIAGGEPAQVLHRRLIDRLSAAREEENRSREAHARRDGLVAERQAFADEAAVLAARIGSMASHFCVATVDEVEQKLALASRRKTLEAEIEMLSRELADSLGMGDTSQIDAQFAGADRQALAAEVEALRPECEALDEETARAYAAYSGAEQRLQNLGSDADAARLSEARRTVLLEIEEGARHYLELRLGAIATDQALRLYRDRHQSSMLLRASEAFSQLSRGNYRGLAAQRDGQRETLIALGADGSSKQAKDMSKGTQFQLYLALRVAGYQEYAATRPTVPFVADDIMESFDEERSAEALTQLALMARSGQVIYLTHHQHICDIARAVCPTVTVHDL